MKGFLVDPDGRHRTLIDEPGAGSYRPEPRRGALPSYDAVADQLPSVHWPAQPDVEAAVPLAWRLTWQHLHPATPDGTMPAPYVDAAFNGCVFLWDGAFTQRFTTYARRVLDIDTLAAFYVGQEPDGFICRTLALDGTAKWDRHDPCSTGPNVLAWTESVLAQRTGDCARLAQILPTLVAYHRWTRRWRTWPDGGYWTSGWGSGMDGLPRLPGGVHRDFEHGGVTWVDATLQALLSARTLVRLAKLHRPNLDLADLVAEAEVLGGFVDERLWDDDLGVYTDRWPDGSSAGVAHLGSYWALLAGAGSTQRRDRMIAHLDDPAKFGRPLPIPALAADDPHYRADGGYWLGGVWTPTTLMVLDGLAGCDRRDLAHRLASEHVVQVAATAERTGTLWENYAPERAAPGAQARPDFCGWTGASVITATVEHVMGIRTLPSGLAWDVRLLDEHGVDRLPVGNDGTVDLRCDARSEPASAPQLTVRSDRPLQLEVVWTGGRKTVALPAGAHDVSL